MTFSDFVKRLENKWGTGLLGEQFELKNGINFSAEQKGRGTLTLDVKNMFGGSTFIDSSELYRVDASPGKERILKNGDILFVRSSVKREGVGWASAFRETNEPVSFCGFLIRARPLNKNFDSRFLVYYLRQFQVRDRLISRSGQVAITNISQANLSQLPIPLPPIAEQKRIAGILDAADALRVKRRDAIANLDTLLQSTFLTLFGDPVTNPMSWERVSGEDVCKRITVGIVVKPASYYQEFGVPALRSLNIRTNKIETKNLVYISEEDNENTLKKTRVWTGDVLLVRSGQPGTAAIVPHDLDGVNAVDILIATPDQSVVLPIYLCNYFNSPGGKRMALGAQRGQIQKHLNVGALKIAPIPLPPLTLQQQFAAIVESIEKQKAQQRAHLAELDTLFASLQSRAFNGEL